MNYKMVGRFLAQILTVEGLFMIPAVIIGYVCGEDNAMQALLWSILIIAVVVAFLRLTCRHAASGFYAKEGLACVGLGWIGMSLFGGLPFFIAREIPNYVDALFEIVSGFTTTGSSILPAVEDIVPMSVVLEKLQPLAGRYGCAGVPACDCAGRRQGQRLYDAHSSCGKPGTGRW